MVARQHQQAMRSLSRLVVALLLTAIPARVGAEIAEWDEPALDRWFHQGSTTPGVKTDPTLFADFAPGAGFTQTRTGTLLLGFETSEQVPLVAPERYELHSVRITATLVDNGRLIVYDPTPDAIAAIGGEDGQDDAGRPIELYGVGFDNGYQQLGFESNDAAPPEFEESSPLWQTADPLLQRTFNVFPLGDDGTGSGEWGNVFNSAGGEGIYQLDEDDEPELVEITRAPWDSIPWAIGSVDGLSAGDNIPGNSVFNFDVDLGLPGVEQYVQQSLAEGQLAFMLSSLHDLEGFHTGGEVSDFPAFYAREHLAVQFGIASAATLELEFDILSALLPGDYNASGVVDAPDYNIWRDTFGTTTDPGAGADGNGNGQVDVPDYNVWRDNFGNSVAVASSAVPEPTGWWLFSCGVIMLARRRQRVGRRQDERARSPRRLAVANRGQHGFTIVELLVVIAVIGVLVAILLPAIQSAREAARRLNCMNNLKQIGLAVHNFQAARKHLPPPNIGGTFENLGSTFVCLLPYLEQGNLYADYDPDEPVTHIRNRPITSSMVATYLCPSMDLPRGVPDVACGEQLGPGSYMISTRTEYDVAKVARGDLDGAFAQPLPKGKYDLSFRHFLDGTAKTLLIGEVNYGFEDHVWTDCSNTNGQQKWGDHKWAEGYWALSWGHIYWELAKAPFRYQSYNLRRRVVKDNASLRVFRSDHPGGAQFVFVDGSVRFVPESIDYRILRALVTRAGLESDHQFN